MSVYVGRGLMREIRQAITYMEKLKYLLSVGKGNDLEALCRFNSRHEEISDLCNKIIDCLRKAR